MYESIICLGDLHAPFNDPSYIEAAAIIKEKFYIDEQKSLIVFLGDLMDQHCNSPKYVPCADGMSSGEELFAAQIELQAWYDLFPVATVTVGNHCYRHLRNAKLAKGFYHNWHDLFEAPYEWSFTNKLIHKDILFMHGEGLSGKNAALNAAEKIGMNIVIGHVHSFAGIQYNNNGAKTVWGMNVGCGIDNDSYAFAYGEHMLNKPCKGIGVIINGNPHWYTMESILCQSKIS